VSAVAVGPVLLCWNRAAPECAAAAERLGSDLRAAGFEVMDKGSPPGFQAGLLVLLGGDGFLMESVRILGYPATPIFGINFGSVGFLMNRRASVEGLAAVLREGALQIEDHPVLEAQVRLSSGREDVCRAVNDLVMERMGGQGARLRVSIGGILLNEFSGDGVIVSTSTGSTAYNLAAGGPVVHPRVSAMILTPLYPHRAAPFHSLQFPVVLPLDSCIEINGMETAKRPVRLLADGHALDGIDRVVVRDSGLRLRLLRMPSHEFVSTLSRKFIGSQG